MGEYPRSSYDTVLSSNRGNIMESLDRMKTTEDRWIECFRIVDTVLAKVVQVQRLHMDLICEFVTFSDIDNREDSVEKQREECEHLEEEIKSLKKTLLKRVLCSEANDSNSVSLIRSHEENMPPVPNIGVSTLEHNHRLEIKQENDVEMAEENEDNANFVLPVEQVQNSSFIVDMELTKVNVKPSCTSESMRSKEQNSSCTVVFVDADALAVSEVPVDKLEKSREDKTASTVEYSAAGIVRKEDATLRISDNGENSFKTSLVVPSVLPNSQSPKTHMPDNNLSSLPDKTCIVVKQEAYDVPEMETETKVYAEIAESSHPPPTANEPTKRLIQPFRLRTNGDPRENAGTKNYDLDKPFACKICAKNYRRNADLLKHMRVHNDDTVHKCELCSKMFDRRFDFIRHLGTHYAKKPFECEVCAKKFMDKGCLTTHMRAHSGEPLHRCEVCVKTFERRSDLIRHTRVHSGEKPFECRVCRKKFTDSRGLTTHVRIHSGEKPYECGVCASKFNQRSTLNKHMRIHVGVDRPYQCEICYSRFKMRSHLNTHMRVVHNGEEAYDCELCGNRFSQSSGLAKHQLVCNRDTIIGDVSKNEG